MKRIWAFFMMLQLLMAFPQLTYLFPSNVMLIKDKIRDILNFQLISKEQMMEWVMSDAKDQVMDEDNILINIGFLLILAVICTILGAFVYFGIKKWWEKMPPFMKKVAKSLKDAMMFNTVFRSLLMMYLDTSIKSAVSLSKGGGFVNIGVSLAILVGFTVLPFWATKFLLRN